MISRKRAVADVDLAKVRDLVGRVIDPELHLGLAEASILGDVRIDNGGTVEIMIRLTSVACPMRERLVTEVTAAAQAAGADRVQVLVETMSESERMRLASQLRSGPRSLGAARIYAVASGKGGVGKSTISSNLAAALADSGQRVGLIDADVWGHSIPQLFGIRRAPVALKGLMFPVQAHNVALMSVGFLVEEDQPVVWRGPMLHKAIEQFLFDVHWGPLDVLLIDLPPGTGDVALNLMELVPEVQLLAVTTPQSAARTVATRAARMALDARVPIAGVIENMSALVCGHCGEQTALFGQRGGAELAQVLDAPLIGQVPLDAQVCRSGDAGMPVVLDEPASPGGSELRRIAGSLPVAKTSLVGRSLPLSVVSR